MKVEFLTGKHIDMLKDFCRSANLAGFQNNASLEKMKFGGTYDMGEVPRFWGVIKNNQLISVSGCHHWKDEHGAPTMMRCLFRSATLPEFNGVVPGLSKYHMNSLPFSVMLPFQIDVGLSEGVKHFYITTSNGNHDASGKMKRTHRALQLLEKLQIVKYAGDEIFYSTPQTKWEIHVDNYLAAIREFHPTREKLNLGLNDYYYKIINQGFNTSWGGFCTPLPFDHDTYTKDLVL